ncbi:bifunctional precorrin-2 dehydrogenase/sirohydrochlorin ferrochelatase, partial [uncultured Agrobacterium sp.]|uniref:precorrin-2 dehydrogenase/sirohydrochlorin ferrochelatase family protein n=1 Tax=uncultured Agrobacterium sp. TaxID=157277 RepID=UPI0025E32B37
MLETPASRSDERLTTFPTFFKVEGKHVAVFGNGDEAYAKARLLSNTNAQIVAFSDQPQTDYAAFLDKEQIRVVAEPFDARQVEGMTLVFAATGDDVLDREIVDAARAKSIPANAVDQPGYCDFYTPGLVSRAPLAVAICT